MAADCDAVFHNAALVSILRDYTALRGSNVESTRWLLRLAARRSVPFHLVSTLSVAPARGRSAEVPEVPEAFLPYHEGLISGYQQSKWVAERLLEQAAERGLPVTVHRLGRVVGPAGTGYVNERDFLWGVLRAGIPAGVLPELFETEVWTPVDYVAEAVVRLATHQLQDPGGVFNHAPIPGVRLADLYGWVREYGYPVTAVPLARWHAELPRTADIAATTLAFFDSWTAGDDDTPDLGLGLIRTDRARRGLHGSGISCPAVDRELVFRYLDHCVSAGLLPAPSQESARPSDSREPDRTSPRLLG